MAPSQPLFDIMPMQQMLSEKTIGLQYIAAVKAMYAALATRARTIADAFERVK